MTPMTEHQREADFHRWAGGVDQQLASATDRLDKLNGQIDDVRKLLAQLSLDVAVIKTRVAIYSALGSLAGGAVVSFIASQLSR